MKNKFLVLAAVSATALGSAIVSTPAQAQIAQGSGPSSTFNVNVTVPEILYLRTVQSVQLPISVDQLLGAGASGILQQVGTTNGYINNPPVNGDQTQVPGTNDVDPASPFNAVANNATVPLSIPKAFIVWSNSPSGTYKAALSVPSTTFDNTATGTSLTPTITSDYTNGVAASLTNPQPQAIDFTVPLDSTTKPGTYTGTIRVDAYSL